MSAGVFLNGTALETVINKSNYIPISSGIIPVSASDYLEVWVSQNSGGAGTLKILYVSLEVIG
jgi:hypothetical protein